MTDADDQMVRRMLERRRTQEDRRVSATMASAGGPERRVVCTYCFQPGDHKNTDDCLRALSRPERRPKPEPRAD